MKRSINSGKYNRKLILQANTSVLDEAGGHTNVMVDLATVWAEIVPASGDEIYTTLKPEDVSLYKITIRYRSGVDNSMFLKEGDITRFNILSAQDPDGTRRELVLTCQERKFVASVVVPGGGGGGAYDDAVYA